MDGSHATTGTEEREPRVLSGQGLRYSLDQERKELASAAVGSAGRTAKTLAKSDTLRITLVRLTAGNSLDPAASAGAASVQVLSGKLSIQADGSNNTQAQPGELLVFSENLRDPIVAIEDSTFLVTVAWQEGAGAWEEEEQEGRH